MSNSANIEELSQKKISKLLWQYALPAIVGTIVNTLYNIIDGVFIGHWVGKEALSALGVILPIMNLTAAVGMLVGAGSASRMSIYLGLKNREKAEQIAGTSFVLTLALSGSMIAAILIFLKPILMFAGASEVTYPYARDFLVIFLPGNLFLSMCFNFNNMMRASGYPFKAMYTMLISVIANIVLAPIFILGFGWGMKGAAAATFLSMVISFCFVMHHFLNKGSYIRLRKIHMRFRADIVKGIVSIGLAPFSMQVAASVVVVFYNSQLRAYAGLAGATGDDAIAAFSNANRLMMLVTMIVMGLTQGMQPIVGYNYGAKNYARVKETLIYTIKVATCITSLGFVLGFFFPEVFVKAFSADAEITSLSAVALRCLTLAYVIVGFQIVTSNFFQCIGMASKSIFLSVSRQFLFLLPAMFILPTFFGLNGVWLSAAVSDTLSAITAGCMLIWQIKKFNKALV
ncbi:putative MATE family efflux protein [Dysgonomonas sp. PH5-45]|uniref:MATE family efflux transporter n=1 Tax=unclassified Dysgonomonas TaxID=2630389 RepID=UPI00247573E6|nr:MULTISPECIES: MATE family efflux transporter [unclassified Dysgonomonas]MDH6354926.1 putative MATE family efflux protein [Dysgonomonas sp. PH5-45]MDH6387825.1 putative MATE family efflux protein [Dysgonomonas sp. PH5-37]